jgi:hypothetical protein
MKLTESTTLFRVSSETVLIILVEITGETVGFLILQFEQVHSSF